VGRSEDSSNLSSPRIVVRVSLLSKKMSDNFGISILAAEITARDARKP
jgi:hypothetical protein